MKYMGSKRRIAKEILPIILKSRTPNQWYVEPFCGGCNTIDKVEGLRIANDSNQYIVSMWQALLRGYLPPDEISESRYNDIKNNPHNYDPELVGFAGVAMSFGSSWFGTYARNKRGTNYAIEGRLNIKKQVELLQGCHFYSGSYLNMNLPSCCIIYCDPPYFGVAGYKDKFNHDDFWQWCRDKKKDGHSIFISEYNAPEDFKCIWQSELKTNMNAKYTIKPIEKLFTL